MDALYADLDGTLLGPGGSLVRGEGGTWSLDALHALEACHRAGAEVVLVSGRAHRVVAELARLLGLTSFVCELGGLVVIDGVAHPLGDGLPGTGSVFARIAATGAPGVLLEHFAGRLEPHAPGHGDREVTHVFRGSVDRAEAEAVLAAHGHGTLQLLDNGSSHTPGTLTGLDRIKVYHLLPRGASKAAAVARHRTLRGYARAACVAVGDSPEDLAMAAEVGALWLVANAVREDPGLAVAARGVAGVRIAQAAFGAGVLEAVRASL